MFIGVGSDAMKKNAQTRTGIIRNIVVRPTKGSFSVLIGNNVIRSLMPKPDEIRRRNETETAAHLGTDAFEARSRPAIWKIFWNHGQHQTQVAARRAARH